MLARLTSDEVTTLGSGVDGAAQARGYVRLRRCVANEVQRIYNGLGQLTTEYQEHSGPVNSSTTPKVQYTYSEMAGGAKDSRLTKLTYSNG